MVFRGIGERELYAKCPCLVKMSLLGKLHADVGGALLSGDLWAHLSWGHPSLVQNAIVAGRQGRSASDTYQIELELLQMVS